MIQKVSLYFILPMCIIAFFLALVGVQQIEFGDTYYTFIGSVSRSFNEWKIEIPNIPNVPKLNNTGVRESDKVLEFLINFVNALVVFINAVIYILNIVIMVVNILIQLIQFICTILYQCKDFINRQADMRVLVRVS